MASIYLLEVEWQEAALLGEIASVQYDLMTATRYAREWLKAEQDKAYSLIDALNLAAVTMYTRAFSGGVRNRWRKEDAIKSLGRDGIEWHVYIMHVRDKHIAHSVNSMEEWRAAIRYMKHEDEPKIVGVDCNHSRIVGFSPDMAEAICRNAQTVNDFLKTFREEESARLLALAEEIGFEGLKRMQAPFGELRGAAALKRRQ